MNQGKLVFAQVMEHLPLTTFRRCVARYQGERKVKTFSCLDQFLCMAFAQLTYRESLRDIEACLRAQPAKLYHLGIRSAVARNTRANANAVRDWRIYADYAQSLIAIARTLYANEPFGVDLKESVYALDATTIDLCLSVFPWAPFRSAKAAVKLHTLLDLRGNIPSFIHISDGKMHEVNILDRLVPEPGAFYIMDRGYLDFERLHRMHLAGSYFVTRGKANLQVRRRYSRDVERSTGLICDQTVVLTVFYSRQGFPDPLRRIRFKDPASGKTLIFLSNNFTLPALTVTKLYRCRWQIGVSRKGHIVQSVRDRPRLKDSGLVAGEASWRESKMAEPSDNMLGKEYAQRTRLQRAVNVEVASLHESPVAETVDNARKQQELTETSPMRRFSPAGYQRRHGVKDDVETGEALDARRRKLAEEMPAITAIGKCGHRHQGDGSGRSTVDGRAAKRVRREGPGPVSTPFVKVRQG